MSYLWECILLGSNLEDGIKELLFIFTSWCIQIGLKYLNSKTESWNFIYFIKIINDNKLINKAVINY